ncbi:MAG: hypothetical protein PHV06_10555 [bacterium]|nr:hypothetical protein [bacterium]
MKIFEKMLFFTLLGIIIILFYKNIYRIKQINSKKIEAQRLESFISGEGHGYYSRANNEIKLLMDNKETEEQIVLVQKILKDVLEISLELTGKLDEKTLRAIVLFQHLKGIPETRVLDKRTRIELSKQVLNLNEE